MKRGRKIARMAIDLPKEDHPGNQQRADAAVNNNESFEKNTLTLENEAAPKGEEANVNTISNNHNSANISNNTPEKYITNKFTSNDPTVESQVNNSTNKDSMSIIGDFEEKSMIIADNQPASDDDLITLEDLGLGNKNTVNNSDIQDFWSIIDESVEKAKITAENDNQPAPDDDLITLEDLGLCNEKDIFEESLDAMQPSTSGLQLGGRKSPATDFDSDDSVRDTTWHLPLRKRQARIRISESEDSDTQDKNASGSKSLREIITQKREKPRSTSKIRRIDVRNNKYLRNTGQAYKNKPARQMKEIRKCRYDCKAKISNEVRESIFNSYWAMGSYEKRVSYIGSLITVEEKKVQKIKTVRNRSCSFNYHIHWGTSVHERVCKNCFTAIFDETVKFVNLVANKKKNTTTGIISNSTRGLTSNVKWTENYLEQVRQHILSFPQYESHYARNKTTKKFLPSHLNLQILYDLYCKDTQDSHENKRVCKKIYTQIFQSLNLSFKPPKVDTCTKCDMLQSKMQFTLTAEKKEELTAQLNEHQGQAEKAYTQMKKDQELSLQGDSLVVVTFDLQQCLPTPLLKSGFAFYKRSLWTYNLTIHDCKTKKATCYMWHEASGKRGGNQIASCIYDYIKNLPSTITKIILYSDTCGGQNKNSFVCAMFLAVMNECPHIEFIDHKFLVPGHTHMACDYDHSVIEQAKKNIICIHHPRDYYQMVRTAGKQQQFTVKEMTLEMFFDFEKLLKGPLILRKTNTARGKLYWPEISWFRYTQTKKMVQYKTNLEDESNFQTISFQRTGKQKNLEIKLEVISKTPLPISVEKKRDIMTLLPFIDSDCHEFYRNLMTTAAERADEDPDLDEFEGQEYEE